MSIVTGQEGKASDFVSSSSGAGDSGKVAKLNGDGQIPRPFIPTGYNVQYFTASGTWTKPDNIKYVIIEGVGGGSAGNARSTSNAGGNAGSYGRKKILAASLGATETVTIGSAGTGVQNWYGGTGGNSSFGAHLVAGGNGGTVTGADLSILGQPGVIRGILKATGWDGTAEARCLGLGAEPSLFRPAQA